MSPLELRVKALELAVAVCKSDVNHLVTDARRIEAFLLDVHTDLAEASDCAPALEKVG